MIPVRFGRAVLCSSLFGGGFLCAMLLNMSIRLSLKSVDNYLKGLMSDISLFDQFSMEYGYLGQGLCKVAPCSEALW